MRKVEFHPTCSAEAKAQRQTTQSQTYETNYNLLQNKQSSGAQEDCPRLCSTNTAFKRIIYRVQACNDSPAPIIIRYC